MHAAVANRIGWRIRILESSFAYGAAETDKKRHGVIGAVLGPDSYLRVHRRARSAHRRLRVASAAAVQVESGPQSGFGSVDRPRNGLYFLELIQPAAEE